LKLTALALFVCTAGFALAQQTPPTSTAPAVKSEILAKSTSSWDGTPYQSYPSGQPEVTVVKITIPAHTTLKWHTHPMPNAGYILSGELTVEKKDGTKKHFVAGEVVTETVNSIHRGITGDEPVVLIVFYPGTPGMPISQTASAQ
jgi:quercetin dioxygenase-like cupin family protein